MGKFSEKLFLQSKKCEILNCLNNHTDIKQICVFLRSKNIITQETCENLFENSLKKKDELFEIFYNEPFK